MFQRLGFTEILLILLFVLLLFGSSKLPQLGRAIGDTMREFKKSVKDQEPDKKSEETSAKG